MQQATPSSNHPQTVTISEEDRLAMEIAQRIYAEQKVIGASPTREELKGRHFRIHPPSPEEFLDSPAYAGRYGKGLYQKWREELLYVLDPANGISEWILTGAIGLGKSTAAALALAYKLVLMGCYIDPRKSFRLMEDTGIVFGVYSLFKYKSQDDNYKLLKTMIDGIPFFREHYPRPKHKSKAAADTLEFPRGVNVIAGSTELHAIGLNLLCLLMDEVNFMREAEKSGTSVKTANVNETVSQAQELYDASKRRLDSRFQYSGSNPGLMVLISSRNAESSWLERHIEKHGHKNNVHISDYALWDVKKEVMGYSGDRFLVEVGDAVRSSRVVPSYKDARKEARVVAVPVEHREEFDSDIEGALRDIAGIANVPVSALFKDKQAIQASINPKLYHPFSREMFPITHLDDVPISTYFEQSKILRIVSSFPRPLLNPACARFLHVDLSETGDATGMAMGHISDIVGTKPQIMMDFMLKMLAPDAGEIDFSKIVDFVCFLHLECGYPIKRVSFDRFQSTHARQILTKLGYEAPHYSVDRTDEAYLILRSTIYEGRFSMYHYNPFLDELTRLIHDRVKKKVDHPQGGSKDVSDSVAGVVAQLTTAMGEDKKIRGQTSPADLHPPEPVISLQERLEQQGKLASAARSGNPLV